MQRPILYPLIENGTELNIASDIFIKALDQSGNKRVINATGKRLGLFASARCLDVVRCRKLIRGW